MAPPSRNGRLQKKVQPYVPEMNENNPFADPNPSNRTLAPPGPRALVAPPRQPSPLSRQIDHPLAQESAADLLAIPSSRSPSRGHDYYGGYSNQSSRRSSWSSDGGESRIYGSNPFADSRAPSRAGSDEDVNTQTVMEKYAITPSNDLIIYPEDVEKDDYLHNPVPGDKDRDCNVCTRRGAINVGGLIFVTLGVLALFVAYPIISFVHRLTTHPDKDACENNPMCLNLDVGDVPLLKNIRTTLIDPDTPESAHKIKSAEGKEWELVFSDEFNKDGRTFYEGDDPFLQAVDIWYGVTQDLEWYDPDAVTTKDGKLELTFSAFQNHYLNYRSGMVQSWNQLCFTGGRVEASISLPGRGDTSGFWPGFWTMGNLGRPGYAATTEGMWPYSYDNVCDAGITPNQSSTDGISYLPGMRLPACTCDGEDHPTPGKSRSAPEIDVIEASVHALDPNVPSTIGDVSQSYQIAPFDIWYMPNYEFFELYNKDITHMNAYRGGPYQEAISGITNLNNDWYDGKEYQVYAFEYEPGASGYITWFVGSSPSWKLDGRAIGPNGNVGQRLIPVEPMALIMNFGMSQSFAPLNMTGLAPLLPATMRFDYIRIYQDPDKKSVTCDPEGMETTGYIKDHKDVYTNQNKTQWADTDYDWPKNSFMHGC